VDYGARLTPGGTRTEEAADVVSSLALPQVVALADKADADVFGPSDPTPEEVEAFWTEVDAIVGGLGKDAGFWKRTKARLSLRSLLGGSQISAGLQGLREAATARVRREPGTIERSSTRTPAAPESETP
jgi:hypothetical protein